jgi:hypothetical protein
MLERKYGEKRSYLLRRRGNDTCMASVRFASMHIGGQHGSSDYFARLAKIIAA